MGTIIGFVDSLAGAVVPNQLEDVEVYGSETINAVGSDLVKQKTQAVLSTNRRKRNTIRYLEVINEIKINLKIHLDYAIQSLKKPHIELRTPY